VTFEEALSTELKAHEGLAALVGARVYPVELPPGATLPAVIFKRISGARLPAFAGNAKMATPRIQVTACAADYIGALTVAAQVRACLDEFSGMLGGALGVRSFFVLMNDDDLLDPETHTYYKPTDFEVYYDE